MLNRLCVFLSLYLLSSALAFADDSPGQIFPDATGEKNQAVPAPSSAQDQPHVKPDEATAVPPSTPVVQPIPQRKRPIPPGSALNDATKLVNEAYQGDLNAAKTPEQKAAVVNKLLNTAKEEHDNAACFALLSKANKMAIDNADFDSSSAVIDQMDSMYKIDSLKMKADAALAITKWVRNPDQQKALVPKLEDIADIAMVADRYDIARSMAENGLSSARDANDADLIRDAAAKLREVRVAEAAYAGIKNALVKLADKSTDTDANLAVGRFRCLIKGDWDAGLPMLALGSDVTLKTLAAKEIVGATDKDSQLTLGDGWWKAAEKESGSSKIQMQMRASKWYNEALPNLTGLAKATVEARLKLIAVREERVIEKKMLSKAASDWKPDEIQQALNAGRVIHITAKSEQGYIIGKIPKGTTIFLQYVGGKWKAWGHLATESPDSPNEGGNNCCVAIADNSNSNQPSVVLLVVPAGTANTPFVWVADRDIGTLILRINANGGNWATHPDAGVSYRMGIVFPQKGQ